MQRPDVVRTIGLIANHELRPAQADGRRLFYGKAHSTSDGSEAARTLFEGGSDGTAEQQIARHIENMGVQFLTF